MRLRYWLREPVEEMPLRVLRGCVVRAGIGFPAGHLADPFLGGVLVPLDTGRRLQRLRVRAEFARRGLRTFAPATVEVRDPLGMASRTVVRGVPFQLLVLPKIEPLQAAGALGRESASSLLRGLASAAGADVDGLRRHRPGAPASRIYWQGLARGGELFERRVSHGNDGRALIVLDARNASQDDLDAAVRAAASVTAHFGARVGCHLALPGRRRALSVGPALRRWEAAHGELARVEHGGRPAPELIAAQQGLLILVSGARTPDLMLLTERRGRGPCIVVVPGPVPAPHKAAFTVSGCSAYLLRARLPATSRAAGRAAP